MQEPVLGVVTPDGTTMAFAVGDVTRALAANAIVEALGVRVVTDGAGLVAETLDGDPITSHQAFWFAWSQFHPETGVWTAITLTE